MFERQASGLCGRTAIVCGSSKGLGYACAVSLAASGAEVILNGRSESSLLDAVEHLSDLIGKKVVGVAADVTQENGRASLLAACDQPDVLVTNAAGPKPRQFESWSKSEWMAALDANMVAPILLIRAVLPPMRQRRWGRIINITSSAVKAPLPMLGLSNGARTGLTGVIAGLAREVALDGITINNLLPGHFATDRLDSYIEAVSVDRNLDAAVFRQELADGNPMGRFGYPAEFGAACAFLASEQAGFITGQNLLIDGGAFPGTL